MAEIYKQISDFPATTQLNDTDLFLLSQGGITKTISGSALREAVEPESGSDGITEITTSTPTTISGLLKGASGRIAKAVENTDYIKTLSTSTSVSGSMTGILKASGGKLTVAVQGTDYAAPGDNSSSPNAPSYTPIVTVTASKTLALADAQTLQDVNSTSARTITIPTNASVAFPVGTEIEVFRRGSGAVTIAAASGVTIWKASTVSTIKDRYTSAVLKKMQTNTWSVQGNLG